MKWLRDQWLLAPHAVGLTVFLSCQGAAVAFPALKIGLFCWPAALAAGVFLGAPVSEYYGNEPLLTYGLLDVRVTESCSGFDFFSLLLAVFFGMTVHHRARSSWLWVSLLPLAGVATLLANVARIVCSVHLRVFSHSHPIGLSDGIIHFAVGTAVFATLLVACCYAMKRFYEYDTHRPAF